MKKKKKTTNPIFKIDPFCNKCGDSLQKGYVVPAILNPNVTKVSTVCIPCWDKARQDDFNFLKETIFGEINPNMRKCNSFEELEKLQKRMKKNGRSKK